MHQTGTKAGHKDDHSTEDDNDRSEDGQDNKPKPEEDVSLLIDNVEGEDTDGIVLFNGGRWTESVKEKNKEKAIKLKFN